MTFELQQFKNKWHLCRFSNKNGALLRHKLLDRVVKLAKRKVVEISKDKNKEIEDRNSSVNFSVKLNYVANIHLRISFPTLNKKDTMWKNEKFTIINEKYFVKSSLYSKFFNKNVAFTNIFSKRGKGK